MILVSLSLSEVVNSLETEYSEKGQKGKPKNDKTSRSSQPKGDHIKEDKGKKALSSKEAEKESTNSNSNDETHVTGSMVEPFRTKKLKKFDFIIEDDEYWWRIYKSEDLEVLES
ncbi:hypothetical protein Tco_0654880 [Tanacetum coccineum]|uniref:Uncharacterized protein n=1 Tax=Tanacetum coccineum TaxID=301880 RepID=A0ABQ4X4J8_9ASTR